MGGSTVPATGFDGKEYWNKEQQIADVMEYTVEYSLEGGAPGTWVSAGSQCQGNRDSCIIEDLPAGSTAVFRVMSGGAGGWGLPSDITAVKTAESDASKACNSMLRDQANGSYFPPGSIVAIIFGVLAVVCLRHIKVASYLDQPGPVRHGSARQLQALLRMDAAWMLVCAAAMLESRQVSWL